MWKSVWPLFFVVPGFVRLIPDCSKFVNGEFPSPRILLLGPTGKEFLEKIHFIK